MASQAQSLLDRSRPAIGCLWMPEELTARQKPTASKADGKADDKADFKADYTDGKADGNNADGTPTARSNPAK